MIKEFETAFEIKKKRDFNKKINKVGKFAREKNDKTMMDYLESLRNSFDINQKNREKLNQFLDETLPVLDDLIKKYEKSDDAENLDIE